MAARRSSERRSEMSYRQRRRAQSHDEAMDGDHESHASDVPEHPLIPAGDPVWIESAAELTDLAEHIRQVGSFAYDTEFIGELSYVPRICVIQLATPERLILVDPLTDLDLTPIWQLIADPDVRTVVHAGVQDLEPVVRFIDAAPANIFDTQIASGFIGLPYPVSLRKLVQELAGVRLGKALTFTQWDHRPLSIRHQNYAADDVRYLPAIVARLDAMLEERGHTAWAAEECDQLTRRELYRVNPSIQYRRLRQAEKLDARQLTILLELYTLRDELARKQDVPPRTMLKDELLVRMARDKICSTDRLSQLKGMPRPTVERFGARFIEAVQRGLDAEPIKKNGGPRHEETPTERFDNDSLLAAASACCLGRGVDTSLVLTRADITSFRRRVAAGQDVEQHRFMQGWRRDLVGDPLLALMNGRLDVSIHWNSRGLHATTAPRSAETVGEKP